MNIKDVELINFRNYEKEQILFSPNINIVYGKNAQGKTNLIESLYLLSNTKSFKTNNDSELIRHKQKNCSVNANIEKNYGKVNIKVEIKQNDAKTFYINNNKLSKVSEVFGNLCVVFFSPDELYMIKGAPADRRNFMDIDISQISSVYYEILNRFDKILVNRNKLLKTKDIKLINESIDVWDEQFATYASKIIITRKKFISKLVDPANENLKYLTDDIEKLTLEYDGAKGDTEQEIKENILSSLKRTLSASIELGFTLIGPQRDDLIVMINDKEVKNYGSQGQTRSVVLAIKLAELEIFNKELNDMPVLILDDVFSELDSKRKNKLMKKIKNVQTIITCTNQRFGSKTKYNLIKIENGRQK